MPKRNQELAREIGLRIARRRKELGWSQEETAERAGLSARFLACVERGEKSFSADSIVKTCQALNIPTDYLLTGHVTASEVSYIQKLLAPMNETQRKAAEDILKNLLLACGYEIPLK